MDPLKPLADPPKPQDRYAHSNMANAPRMGTGRKNEAIPDEEIEEAFRKAGGQPKVKVGKLSYDFNAYKPEYCQSLIDFFDRPPTREITETWYHSDGSVKREGIKEIPNSPPHLGQWAMSIGFYPIVPYEWAKRHRDFHYALQSARSLRKHLVIDNALKGLYNPIFSKLAAANWWGWTDKQEIKHDIQSVMVTYHKPSREAPEKVDYQDAKLLEAPPGPNPSSERSED